MKRALLLLLLAAAACAQSPAPTLTGEFELKIDGTTIDVSEGHPFEMTVGAQGEKVKATLVRRKTRIYQGGGLKFEFGSDFKLTEERDGDLTTITLDHPRSPMAMIQIFPAEVKPEDVPKELLDGIKKEFKDKAATLTREPAAVQRDFKSGKLTGQGIQYKIGGQQIEVEVYGWSVGARTVALTLQWSTEEADIARNLLSDLARSIEEP